jgi:hypothetical protein
MDRDLDRAKADLDMIEDQTQRANDARMIRIKKAVKTGNLYAPLLSAALSMLMLRSDEIDKLTDEVSREKAQAWVSSLQVAHSASYCFFVASADLLKTQASDDASANRSARMDELRSNLAALTMDFSGAPPASHLRNRPPSSRPSAQHALDNPATSVEPGHGDGSRDAFSCAPSPSLPVKKSTVAAPQPFSRRDKQKI